MKFNEWLIRENQEEWLNEVVREVMEFTSRLCQLQQLPPQEYLRKMQALPWDVTPKITEHSAASVKYAADDVYPGIVELRQKRARYGPGEYQSFMWRLIKNFIRNFFDATGLPEFENVGRILASILLHPDR